MDGIFILFVVFVIIVAVIIVMNQISNQNKAEESAKNFIENFGIRQSVIKQSPTTIKQPSLSPPQGVLILTYDTLRFIGTLENLEIPITTIRSTSLDGGGSDILIIADAGTYRFHWDDVKKSTRGLGATNGGIGVGMALSNFADPIVQEWRQLIDDLRFGKINKPV